MKQSIILIAVTCLLLGTKGQAQDIQSSTQGFSINANMNFGSWNSNSYFFGELDEIEPSGVGFGIKIGYGVNQNIEAFLSYNSTSYAREFDWENYNQSTILLGGSYIFGATLRKFRPFVEAALSFNTLMIDPITFDGYTEFELKTSGAGGSLGGGIQYFVKENLSVSATGRVNFGTYNSAALSGMNINIMEENLDFSITTIHIGVSYYFE
jgi:hypothetical protein